MKRAALLTPNLHQHDAVSLDLRGMATTLQNQGYETCLFAPEYDAGMFAHQLAGLPSYIRNKEDIVVLSYAGHWQEGEDYFHAANGFKILRYHNVTPSEFFEPYDANMARHCRSGRQNLQPMIEKTNPDLFLADSSFNAQDLIAAGAASRNIFVVPVFHQIEGLFAPCLRNTPAILPGRSKTFFDRMFQPVEKIILMVGRLVPNKGYENLLKAFAVLQRIAEFPSYLVLAGSSFANLHDYYRRLELIIESRSIGSRVLQTGSISAMELGSLYRRADLFCITSEHEGFCVPVVEAMASGTPVLALDRGAVAETVGEAGLVLPEFDEYEFACAMQRILIDKKLNLNLQTRGQTRYNNIFKNENTGRQLQEILEKRI